ncbi:MAG: nitroreductase family protein [Sphaerochaetaceae bacterium]|jgi:predicted oxidoreductase (fatty acid repression mutant protein)
MSEFVQAIKQRRSIYALGKNPSVGQDSIVKKIEEVFTAVPSAFNSQSARLVVLFGKEHDQLWDIVMDTLRQIVPAGKFGPTEEKINGFKAAYGTIMFFDDTSVTDGFAANFPSFAANFKPWADQANGMLQFALWTALEDLGLGANLQHYNPLIDEKVAGVFNLPKTWRLIAEMTFGEKLADAGPKETIPAADRMRVLA